MKRGVRAATACWLLLTVGCTSESGAPAGKPSARSNVARSVGRFEVVGDCGGLGGLGGLRGGQLSFVAAGELFVARPTADLAHCAARVRHPLVLDWGPTGDRVSFGDLRRFDGEHIVSIDDAAESVAWSRPTGRSVVYVSEGRLMKVDAFGREPYDISFLADHDEVVYHPAGTHIAVTGTDDDGTYGLWLATNVGEEAQLLAIGEDARRIYSLAFAHDGKTLYYAAEHDDRYDMHALRLAVSDDRGEVRDAELATLDSDSAKIDDVVVSEFADGAVAYTAGSCEHKTTRVYDGSVTELGGELAGLSTEPVGWLPNGDLLVLGRRAGCDGKGTLYAWRSDQTRRVVGGVSAAGVRVALPPPPEPPDARQQVVA